MPRRREIPREALRTRRRDPHPTLTDSSVPSRPASRPSGPLPAGAARTPANYNSRQPPRRPAGSAPGPPPRDFISQHPARPPDPSFPGAAPRPWIGGGGGGRRAANGASWGRRRRERGRAGLRAVGANVEHVESAGAGGQGVSRAGRARGAGGGSAVAPQPGPRSPCPPQHGRGPSPAEVAASHPLCARLTPAPLSLPVPVPVPRWLPGVAPERPPGVALGPLWGCRQAGVAFQVVCGLSIMAGCFPAPLGRIWALAALADQCCSFGCPSCARVPGCVCPLWCTSPWNLSLLDWLPTWPLGLGGGTDKSLTCMFSVSLPSYDMLSLKCFPPSKDSFAFNCH